MLTKAREGATEGPPERLLAEMAVRTPVQGKATDGWAAVEFAPLFSGILPQEYRRISATARVKEFARGEMLYLEGDSVEHVYLLASGFAKITQLGPRGTEVILRLGVPGDVLGAISLFSSGSHCTTAQALRLGYALVWEARVFKPLVESLPILHQNFIARMFLYLRLVAVLVPVNG